mgnify:CR=1 FL=1
MTVAELIQHLKTFPSDLRVAYHIYSEQALLEEKDVLLAAYTPARPDGWIENARPDKRTETYVMFPGN